jgi:hypothetical protein
MGSNYEGYYLMNSLVYKICAVFFLVFLTCSGIASTSNTTTQKKSAELSVELNYKFKLTNIPSSAKQIFAWIPMPVSNRWQTCESYRVAGDRSYTVVTDPVFGNQFLRFDYSQGMKAAGLKDIITEVTFRTKRKSFHLLNEDIQGEMIGERVPEELYLAANRLIPISGKIADEAMAIAGTDKNPLHQAKQLFDHIIGSVSYDKSGVGWGKGDAEYACDVRKGNCTDFHSLFIGEARSLEIPSRFIMGIPIPESKNGGIITGYHCWAEFYLEDRGWIPIDASEASKFQAKKDMLFGGLDENRVQFTIGRDIQLPLAQSGPVNYAIYPHVEIDGELSSEVETTFHFQKL